MAVRRLADAAIQPKSFAFTIENLDWAKGEIAKYPEGRQASAILALLWRAQEQAGGWLPQKAIEHIADLLGMPKIRALEVATFYTMFNLAPVGQFHVQLCGTTPCVLRGADKLIKLCHDTIGEPLNVSADGKRLWLSGRYDNAVYVIDTTTGEVVTIPAGKEPHGLTVWPQPGRYSLGHTGNMR